MQLTYWVPSRDEESMRIVDPVEVVSANGFDYLDAWCHLAEAPRLFRLDRIHRAQVLKSPDRRSRQAAETLRRPVGAHSGDGHPGDAAVGAGGRLGAGVLPGRGRSTKVQGWLEIDLLVGDEQWLERLLLRLAPAAEVVSPVAFADRFKESAMETLNLYAGLYSGDRVASNRNNHSLGTPCQI